VPVYNGAAHLAQTLESLLAQTFADFELLVIDDGSTDSSGSIARSFKDERIRVVRTENQGLVQALNTGIREARAPYIARSDHDDISVPTRLEKQLKVMREQPDTVAVFSFNSKFGTKHVWSNRDKFANGSDPVREYQPETDGCLLQSTMLARTDALRALNGFRAAYYPGEDLDLECRLSEAGRVMVVCEPLVAYRFRLGGMTYGTFRIMQLKAGWAQDSHLRRMRNEPEVTFEEYLASLPADRWSRLARRFTFSSREHMRIGGQRYLDGHYLASAAHFSMSALLDPGNMSRRIKRLAKRFV